MDRLNNKTLKTNGMKNNYMAISSDKFAKSHTENLDIAPQPKL